MFYLYFLLIALYIPSLRAEKSAVENVTFQDSLVQMLPPVENNNATIEPEDEELKKIKAKIELTEKLTKAIEAQTKAIEAQKEIRKANNKEADEEGKRLNDTLQKCNDEKRLGVYISQQIKQLNDQNEKSINKVELGSLKKMFAVYLIGAGILPMAVQGAAQWLATTSGWAYLTSLIGWPCFQEAEFIGQQVWNDYCQEKKKEEEAKKKGENNRTEIKKGPLFASGKKNSVSNAGVFSKRMDLVRTNELYGVGLKMLSYFLYATMPKSIVIYDNTVVSDKTMEAMKNVFGAPQANSLAYKAIGKSNLDPVTTKVNHHLTVGTTINVTPEFNKEFAKDLKKFPVNASNCLGFIIGTAGDVILERMIGNSYQLVKEKTWNPVLGNKWADKMQRHSPLGTFAVEMTDAAGQQVMVQLTKKIIIDGACNLLKNENNFKSDAASASVPWLITRMGDNIIPVECDIYGIRRNFVHAVDMSTIALAYPPLYQYYLSQKIDYSFNKTLFAANVVGGTLVGTLCDQLGKTERGKKINGALDHYLGKEKASWLRAYAPQFLSTIVTHLAYNNIDFKSKFNKFYGNQP